jgi:hypothetical protein
LEHEIEQAPIASLRGDIDALIESFVKKHTPTVPSFTDSVAVDQPETNLHSSRVSIKLHLPFDGDAVFFNLSPTQSPVIDNGCEVKNDRLILTVPADMNQIDRFQREKEQLVTRISECLDRMRRDVEAYLRDFPKAAKDKIEWRLDRDSANARFVDQLSSVIQIRRRGDDSATRLVIPVERKPAPILPPPKISEPLIELTAYDDILITIDTMATVFERSPKAFQKMEEEELRAVLLVALNGLYEGGATGETFNAEGKTDILIRHNDRNVFIAECLIWKGEEVLRKKMDEQLFRYATWHDSKLALLIFNRNKGFSAVVGKMIDTVSRHPQMVRRVSSYNHDSGARFIFKRADDAQREFTLTVLAFDVPSPATRVE